MLQNVNSTLNSSIDAIIEGVKLSYKEFLSFSSVQLLSVADLLNDRELHVIHSMAGKIEMVTSCN